MESLQQLQSHEEPSLALVLPDAAEVLNLRELETPAKALGRTILTGEEARLAQFLNLTQNVRPARSSSFVRFR